MKSSDPSPAPSVSALSGSRRTSFICSASSAIRRPFVVRYSPFFFCHWIDLFFDELLIDELEDSRYLGGLRSAEGIMHSVLVYTRTVKNDDILFIEPSYINQLFQGFEVAAKCGVPGTVADIGISPFQAVDIEAECIIRIVRFAA